MPQVKAKSTTGTDNIAVKPPPAGVQDEPLNMEYSDSLLLDLFHLDTKHFFTRYKTDFWGLMLSIALVFALIFATMLVVRIGE